MLGKKVFCDLDGTFIDSDLEKNFVSYLIKNKKLNLINYCFAVFSIPINKISKWFGYGDKIKSWALFKNKSEISLLFNDFILEYKNKININKVVKDKLLNYKRQGYSIVLLTASNSGLVEKFLSEKNELYIFDELIGSVLSKHGVFLKVSPYGKSKCKFIKIQEETIGIANEYVDRYYLAICKKSYVITDDIKLINMANKMGWEVL